MQGDIAEMRAQIATQRGSLKPELVPDEVRRALAQDRAAGWAYVTPMERPPLIIIELE